MKLKIKKIAVHTLILILICILTLSGIYMYTESIGNQHLTDKNHVPNADAILILGAYVFPNGEPSHMLQDRLNVGLELYNSKKAPKIIVSGDHGQTTYDEVNNMRKYLESKGIPREDIFMDHAGFNTYDSMYRARDIFLVKKAIIVSQSYHVKRALYISDKLGLEAYGVPSDLREYLGMKSYLIREVGSRFKAFAQAELLHSKPKYLGKTIPITGSGEQTADGK